MKTLMMTIFLLSSISASAITEIAKYRFATHSETIQDVYRVYETSLNTSGQLKVDYIDYKGDNWNPTEDVEIGSGTYTKVLTNNVFKILESQIQYFSTVKVIVERAVNWCEIMPSPEVSIDHLSLVGFYDEQTDTYKKAMRLVLGPEGCWVQVSTRPNSMRDYAPLKQLTGMIKILALNI